MNVPRIDEDASFGCIAENCKGVVVFESTRLTDGAGKVTRTVPKLMGGGVLLKPHTKPNWIGRWCDPQIRAERSEANAIPKSAICERCYDGFEFAEDIREGRIHVTKKLSS